MVLTLSKRYPVVLVYEYFRIPKGVFAFLGKGFVSENVEKFLVNYATKIKSSSPQVIKW
jgi:hypothetical protein